MTFPISVQSIDGQFRAALVGDDSVFAVAATREAAISSVRAEIAKRVGEGDLASVDVETTGIRGLFGKFADDPTLDDICREAYAERDRDRDRQNR